jgi:hypothetical protein
MEPDPRIEAFPEMRVVLDRRATAFYKPRANTAPPPGPGAQVAQLVEHVTENHGVAGSIPALGTSPILIATHFVSFLNLINSLFEFDLNIGSHSER